MDILVSDFTVVDARYQGGGIRLYDSVFNLGCFDCSIVIVGTIIVIGGRWWRVSRRVCCRGERGCSHEINRSFRGTSCPRIFRIWVYPSDWYMYTRRILTIGVDVGGGRLTRHGEDALIINQGATF